MIRTTEHRFQVPELLHLVFTFLPPRSLAAASRVSHLWFSISLEHLWKSIAITDCLNLVASGRHLLRVTTSQVRSPKDYELKLTTAEAIRLSTFARCIITLEYPYSLHTAGFNNPSLAHTPYYLFGQLIDRYYQCVVQFPHLFGHSVITSPSSITLRTLFPRLRNLRGTSAATFFVQSRDQYPPGWASFTVPLSFNPLQSVLQPLCVIYDSRATAIPRILSSSSSLTLDSLSLEPKAFLDLRRNHVLEYLDVTKKRDWVVRDDWTQVAHQAGWSAAEIAESEENKGKPPLKHLSLTMYHVHHFFATLVGPDMFGEVLPHLRTLRLKNLKDDSVAAELPAISTSSEGDSRFVSESDSGSSGRSNETSTSSSASAFGGGPRTVWPRITRRTIRSEDCESDRMEDPDDEPTPPGGYVIGTTSRRINSTSGTVPLTATALQQLEGPILTETIAEEAGHQSSEDLDLTEAEEKGKRTASGEDSDIVTSYHHRRGTSYATALDDFSGLQNLRNPTTTDVSDASELESGFKDLAQTPTSVRVGPSKGVNNRLRFLNISSPSSSSGPSSPAAMHSEDEDEDEDDQPDNIFPNIWDTDIFNGDDSELSTDDDDDNGNGLDEMEFTGLPLAPSPTPVPPPTRSFLELIATSCPNLEVLSLSGNGWDFSVLLLHSDPTGGDEGDEGEEQLSKIELGVDFRGTLDAEERTDILVDGIDRALKQWKKGKGKSRTNDEGGMEKRRRRRRWA
ncbi:hypothetical protein FRB94_013895 [Tulasnella sp. JGI-2019a]|nr:hypothetical protein FRB93_008155 [Tulasnella sp. JGI-2019a]KAG8989896.1 hypothetical protein FRB94_013895 [Tulasnella sp. JGI-2019a]